MSLSCKRCGKVTIRKNQKFCSGCGAPMELVAKSPFDNEKDTAVVEELDMEQIERRNLFQPYMMLVKGGAMKMGSIDGYENEKPLQKIEINSFYMCKYLVTNMDYYEYDPRHSDSDEYLPVTNISWYDAVSYCNWLSWMHGLEKSYRGYTLDLTKNGYRLPTEAEWEYACRAGTRTKYYWGNEIRPDYLWYWNNSDGKIHEVGEKKPNTFGIYDMLGNVWEWCEDFYGYYSSDVPKSTDFRILRGGSWYSNEKDCCSSTRNCYSSRDRYFLHGFRIARND